MKRSEGFWLVLWFMASLLLLGGFVAAADPAFVRELVDFVLWLVSGAVG